METINLVTDIVVGVSGGVVTDVFGPEGTTVLVVDFDDLRDGGNLSVVNVDGTQASKECQAILRNAIILIERRKSHERRSSDPGDQNRGGQ